MKAKLQNTLMITRVTDSQGDAVPDSGVTESLSLVLSGEAPANIEIQLLDNDSVVSTVPVTINGTWRASVEIALGEHDFFIRATGVADSEPWKVTRQESSLTIDTSTMTLDGLAVIGLPGWTRTDHDSDGNTAVRNASGGAPPYDYVSADPAIASVDAAGKVTGNRNGTTWITVKDRLEHSVSYEVEVSQVWQLVANEGVITYQELEAWIEKIGGAWMVMLVPHVLERYSVPLPLDKNYWLNAAFDTGYEYFNYQTQSVAVTENPSDPDVTGGWALMRT